MRSIPPARRRLFRSNPIGRVKEVYAIQSSGSLRRGQFVDFTFQATSHALGDGSQFLFGVGRVRIKPLPSAAPRGRNFSAAWSYGEGRLRQGTVIAESRPRMLSRQYLPLPIVCWRHP